MNEDKKIENLLNEYKELFETTTADISKSYKGRRFFFYTDRVCNELYCIKEFATADELEKKIIYELADQINMSLENTFENVKKELDNIDNSDKTTQLLASLETIQKELCRLTFIQKLSQGISTYIEKYKES